MPSDEFIASVEDMIARHFVIDASMDFVTKKTGKVDRDGVFESVVYRLLRAAMEKVRKQLAVPRSGTMTFAEAMRAVANGKLVTRPGWEILRALARGPKDNESSGYVVDDWVVDDFYRLDNLDGAPTGNISPYVPTDEDRAATDWMQYQRPMFDMWIDYGD